MRTARIEEMKSFLKENNLTHLVRELVAGGSDSDGAIEWVYDSHTLSRQEFLKKYFG